LAALDPLLAQLPPLSPPEDHGRFPIPPGIFYSLFGVGFIMGLVGHLPSARPRWSSAVC
jgi:hypothetical protein